MAEYNAVLYRQCTIGAASANTTLSGQASRVYICSTGMGFYFHFSSAAVTNTGTFLPFNQPILIPAPHPTGFSAINATAATTTGTATIIEFIH